MMSQGLCCAAVKRLGVVLLIGGTGLLAGCGGSEDKIAQDDAIERGRQYTAWLYAQDIESLRPHVAGVFRDGLGGLSGLDQDTLGLVSVLGTETSVASERVLALTDETVLYQRTCSFAPVPMPMSIEWAMRGESLEIWNLAVRPLMPEAPSDHMSYVTQADLRLPFEGQWMVLWGGRAYADNYHADAPDQRFASDFVVFQDGYFFSGDGSRNEDHYCFGKAIVAPADGVVVASEGSVPDNLPGGNNFEQPLGNHVILDHGNGEFSFLCHFRQGTTAVGVGDHVQRGQFLGQCGNSGGSDIPHLHHHLQNTPVPFGGEGLPIQFRGYRANGMPIAKGELVRGQSIRSTE